MNVGKTTQCLSERIKQHIPAKILTDPPVLKKNKAYSAITRHLKESIACLQPDVTKKFKILAQARRQRHLDVLEAIYPYYLIKKNMSVPYHYCTNFWFHVWCLLVLERLVIVITLSSLILSLNPLTSLILSLNPITSLLVLSPCNSDIEYKYSGVLTCLLLWRSS